MKVTSSLRRRFLESGTPAIERRRDDLGDNDERDQVYVPRRIVVPIRFVGRKKALGQQVRRGRDTQTGIRSYFNPAIAVRCTIPPSRTLGRRNLSFAAHGTLGVRNQYLGRRL